MPIGGRAFWNRLKSDSEFCVAALVHGYKDRFRNPNMFRSLSKSSASGVQVFVNGCAVTVPEGSTVWGAMAISGDTVTRLASVTGQPRSAYCAMGVCFDCLVEIDGTPNQQACMTKVHEGMEIVRQEVTQNTLASEIAMELPEMTNAAEEPVCQ